MCLGASVVKIIFRVIVLEVKAKTPDSIRAFTSLIGVLGIEAKPAEGVAERSLAAAVARAGGPSSGGD